ncbi:MAG: hypothetical protein JNN17_10620 [Verrucomicrobiaceae bacterium]|nr:hypothetical protein [Verrucomicrobiaceae bacterium]
MIAIHIQIPSTRGAMLGESLSRHRSNEAVGKTGEETRRAIKRIICFAIASACAFGLPACKPAPVPAPAPSQQERVVVGELNKDGRLIFWTIDAFDHEEPFVLSHEDYGVILINEGDEKTPKAIYKYASQRGDTTRIVSTSSFEEFKALVNQIPKGSALAVFATCSVPRHWGLKESVVQQFNKTLEASGLSLVERGVCYCPSGK